jgi:hypothetical protein
VKEITPPQLHISVLTLSNAGALSNMTGGDIAPVIHGAGVNGMQGIGVSTPSAAVVAAAVAGNIGLIQLPKGCMLTIGT